MAEKRTSTPFVLAVLIGIVPSLLAAGLQWYLGAGTDQEIQGGLAYLVPVLAAWWAGVSAGVMVASERAGSLKAGALTGVLSVLPFVFVTVLAREAAERAAAAVSPAIWGTGIGAMAIPTIIGLLFAEKQLNRKR